MMRALLSAPLRPGSRPLARAVGWRGLGFASLLVLGAMLALPTEATAQDDPASAARAAAQAIEDASAQLAAAQDARDRVAALTETTRAFEAGLAAMRDGMRRVSAREAALSAELIAREDEIARLIGTLQVMGQTGSPTSFLHPAGPMGTARSAMIVADVADGLDRQAIDLREKLTEVQVLRQLQQSASDRLAAGLTGVQDARTALSMAVSDRTDLPRKFTENPIQTALLIASTETLDAFASGLATIAENETNLALPLVSDRKGQLPAPVLGRVLRRAGEADAAGITRPGIILATRARALVTSPTAATIRYRGPLLDYGNVIILEPQAGLLFVFAGLDLVYGATGEVIAAGAPIGLMGASDAVLGTDLTNADAQTRSTEARGKETGAGRSETLYIEVRSNNRPEDPADWFEGMKD